MKQNGLFLFATGFALGGAVTALCTPYSGRRARRMLNHRAVELSDGVSERIQEAMATSRAATRPLDALRRRIP